MYTKYIICTSEVFSQKYFSMRVSLKKLLTVSNSKYTDIYKNVMLLNMLEQKSVTYFLKQSKQAICICDRNSNYVEVLKNFASPLFIFVIWIHQESFEKSDGSGILQEILKNSEVYSRRILYSKYKLLFESRFPPSPFAFDSTNFFIMYIYYDVIIVVYDLFVCSRYDFIIYS